jgi:hypothetical protein
MGRQIRVRIRVSGSLAPIGAEENVQVSQNPGFGLAFAINGPAEERPANHSVDGGRELGGGAPAKFSCKDSSIEQRADLIMELARVGEGQAMEVPIGQIHFQKREMVGQSFRSLSHLGHAARNAFQRAERRAVHRADACKFLAHAGCALPGQGEKQAAFGAEALQERGGSQAGLPGDVSEGEAVRADAFDDAGGAGQEFGISLTASTGRHAKTINKRAFTNKA